MQQFEGITAAADAVNEWFWSRKNSLSEELVGIIQPLLGPTKSAVDLVVKTAEEIYKRRDDLDGPTLQLAAGLASFCYLWGFHGMDEEARGQKMSLALRRDSGEPAPEGVEWPAVETDPEPKG
jgi:hypothetical protein